jgi:hypothetical protein
MVDTEEKFKEMVFDMRVGVLCKDQEQKYYLVILQVRTTCLTEDQLLGKTSFDPEWKVIHEDGSPFPGDTHPVPIATRKAVHGVIMGFIVLFLKITFGC